MSNLYIKEDICLDHEEFTIRIKKKRVAGKIK